LDTVRRVWRAAGRETTIGVEMPGDKSPLIGHSLDSSHQRMPCRICSDVDKPVRFEMDWSLSRTSGSIMNVQRFFLITTLRSRIPVRDWNTYVLIGRTLGAEAARRSSRSVERPYAVAAMSPSG
jgi:hypothetical protein